MCSCVSGHWNAVFLVPSRAVPQFASQVDDDDDDDNNDDDDDNIYVVYLPVSVISCRNL